VSYKPLDAWVEALGAESGAQRRTRIGRTGDSIQPVALPEWGSEYLAPPSSDSAFMYGSVEVVGTAANRPAALLSMAAALANVTERQRALWFWYNIQAQATATQRVTMFVDSQSITGFVGVGAGSQHAFNPGAIAANRTLFGGNTAVVVPVTGGLAHSPVHGGAVGGTGVTAQITYGPFYCPQHLAVAWIGNTVGVGTGFLLQCWWRELPILRG
jgi:hypothetical protein